MRLIRCYIENFGKLSKFTYDFNEGVNIIEEENGWGKTTFAAFIKAMFYGMEYRRGKIITDRKLYIPWNGNKFGGYIIFEKDGIEYRIERFFGEKKKQDTLTVYNISQNVVTDDFGDNPGEAIWKVDRDSYEKTAFITLNDSSLLNDIISSKLGDIEDKQADLDTSSKAIDLLDKEMVKIKAKRGNGGLVDSKKQALAELKQELKKYNDSLEVIEKRQDEIKSEEKNLVKIDDEITKIEEEQSKFILYEKKQQYLNLKNDFETKQKEYSEIKSFFKGKVLSEEELYILNEEAGRYLSKKEQADKNKLSKAQEIELKEKIPELFEIEECNENIIALSNKRTQLENYNIKSEDKSRFTQLDNKYKNIDLDSDIIEGYLDDFNQVAEFQAEENNINMEIGKLNRSKEDETKKASVSYVGIGLFVLGVLLVFIAPPLGVGVAVVGLVIGILSILSKSKGSKENHLTQEKIEKLKTRLKEIQKQKEELESGYLSFLDKIGEESLNIPSSLANSKVEISEYNRLKVQISESIKKREEIGQEISELKEQIELFLGKYYNILIVNDYEKALSDLREKVSKVNKLSELNNLHKSDKEEAKHLKEILEEKLAYYYEDFPSNVTDAVNELTKKYYALETSTSKLKESKENKEKFESVNSIVELEKLVLPEIQNNELADNLRKQKEDFSKDKDEVIKKIERYKKDINVLAQDADQIEDTESTIIQLEIDIEDLQKEYDLINLTKQCMIEAKENLATKYMGNMSLTFEKYLNKLNDGETDSYKMDINLDVKVEHEGELYDSNQLSKGMKDLVQLCMRMALVEAVYKDVEKPILVLDDPFANLDNNRINNAMNLLKEISLEYQIIYFTCHSSRNMETRA